MFRRKQYSWHHSYHSNTVCVCSPVIIMLQKSEQKILSPIKDIILKIVNLKMK